MYDNVPEIVGLSVCVSNSLESRPEVLNLRLWVKVFPQCVVDNTEPLCISNKSKTPTHEVVRELLLNLNVRKKKKMQAGRQLLFCNFYLFLHSRQIICVFTRNVMMYE